MAAKINFNKNLVSYIGRYLYLLLKYRVEVACNQFYTQNTFFFFNFESAVDPPKIFSLTKSLFSCKYKPYIRCWSDAQFSASFSRKKTALKI